MISFGRLGCLLSEPAESCHPRSATHTIAEGYGCHSSHHGSPAVTILNINSPCLHPRTVHSALHTAPNG